MDTLFFSVLLLINVDKIKSIFEMFGLDWVKIKQHFVFWNVGGQFDIAQWQVSLEELVGIDFLHFSLLIFPFPLFYSAFILIMLPLLLNSLQVLQHFWIWLHGFFWKQKFVLVQSWPFFVFFVPHPDILNGCLPVLEVRFEVVLE